MDEIKDSVDGPSAHELTLNETRLQSVLTGMLDPVVVIDAHGRILYANESCATVFGYALEELVGRNIKLLMPEPYHSEHDGYLEHYRRTGTTNILGRTREFPVVKKDGSPITCELSVSRIGGIEQPTALYCGSFRDVTARTSAERALVESEHRFRAIFDQEYQFVGLLNPEGTLLEANRAALDAAGVERDGVLGKPFWDTPWWSHSPEEQARLQEAVHAAAQGEFVRFETTHSGADGDLRIFDFSLKPVRNDEGEIILLLPEGRDITDVKRAQQRELAMMRAFADIGESASLLAHEIKNPITAVNAALKAVAKELGEDERNVLGELVERMKKLESLMRRTLSLARPLDLRLETCALEPLLGACATIMHPQLDEQGIVLEHETASDVPIVSVDIQLMEEVITNLIRNAIDALSDHGTIRLSAGGTSNGAFLRIDDDGPGIPDSILKTLFRPFVSTKSNGTGLGLAITRKIVEAHGGSIEVHNSPLGGARFEVLLPAAS